MTRSGNHRDSLKDVPAVRSAAGSRSLRDLRFEQEPLGILE